MYIFVSSTTFCDLLCCHCRDDNRQTTRQTIASALLDPPSLPFPPDMKLDVVMVATVLIRDFIFMLLGLDLVLYILGYFTFYMSHYLG